MKRPIVFLDTETVGLSVDDPIWEIAAIRREIDGTETTFEWHALDREGLRIVPPRSLPEPFRSDFLNRYGITANLCDFWSSVDMLRRIFDGKPTVVGAVPNFDTERIARQFGDFGWHHRLRYVETLAAGHLGREVGSLTDCAEALGIRVVDAHTAMGDVRMVRAIWDVLMTEEVADHA